MTGFVYALRPVGMSVLKIGATTKPKQRARQLAAFSPCPLEFVRLIAVGGRRHALIWEQYAQARTMDEVSHGEWRFDTAAVYAVLDSIPGTSHKIPSWFEQLVTPRKKLPMEEIELRLLAASVEESFDCGRDFLAAFGLSPDWQNLSAASAKTRAKYRRRLEEFQTPVPHSGEGAA